MPKFSDIIDEGQRGIIVNALYTAENTYRNIAKEFLALERQDESTDRMVKMFEQQAEDAAALAPHIENLD